MEEWLLYEHEDGRYAAAPTVNAARFASGNPAWHRVGPVSVHIAAEHTKSVVSASTGGGVELHVEKILQSEELGSEFARCSPTEAVMVAIALCDRTFLPASLVSESGRDLWRRLDASQRAAVMLFGQSAG